MFVTTAYPLEIVAIDILQYNQKRPMLTCIDYYTRMCRAIVLQSKETKDKAEEMSKIRKELGISKKDYIR